jgi:hypothetical protein
VAVRQVSTPGPAGGEEPGGPAPGAGAPSIRHLPTRRRRGRLCQQQRPLPSGPLARRPRDPGHQLGGRGDHL